jgi:hypothetical protein
MTEFADQEIFNREIKAATAEKSPHIHGLLEVLAYRVYTSPSRFIWPKNAKGDESDWTAAVALLSNYADRIPSVCFTGLPKISFENYLKRELSYEARDISKRLSKDNVDMHRDWMIAVNRTADRIMSREGIHYLKVA